MNKFNCYDSNLPHAEVITPKDKNYDLLRQEWNRAIQKFPALIVYCENEFDVSQSILYARENNIPIRIRSGGHNYEGYSTGNKVMVIDISKINSIKINYQENTLTIGGGIKNAQLYNYLSPFDYPFPGGLCPTVGLSGFTLGGGWGYSSRKFGLGCDSLLEAELINYEGYLLKANKYINSDLFWALKGAGGGNFGVVTSMTFKLPPKVNSVTYFEIYCPNTSKETQVRFLDIWQRWIFNVDNSINASGGLYNTPDEKYIFLRGISYNSIDQTKWLLRDFYNLENVSIDLESNRFLAVINNIASSYPPYEKFKSGGRFVNTYYSLEELSNIVDIVNQPRPRDSVLTSINIYGFGGKISAVPKNETAFYYRDARYILYIQSVWEDNFYKEYNVDWVLYNFRYIYNITYGSYINFPTLELPHYEINYFGENIFRLKTIKEKYDPCNVFNFPQSIKI